MQKLEIFLTIVIGLISGIAMLSSQESHAQQNASSPVDFTKILGGIKELCSSGPEIPPPCPNDLIVKVLYQDQSTVALQSVYVDVIWRAVAEVKKYGYKIDDITTYLGDSGVSPTLNILVVMSK